jgi:alpha-glucosidase
MGSRSFVDAVVGIANDTETWWRAEIICHNPVTAYRFILQGRQRPYQWPNGTGIHLRDVPDGCRLPPGHLRLAAGLGC